MRNFSRRAIYDSDKSLARSALSIRAQKIHDKYISYFLIQFVLFTKWQLHLFELDINKHMNILSSSLFLEKVHFFNIFNSSFLESTFKKSRQILFLIEKKPILFWIQFSRRWDGRHCEVVEKRRRHANDCKLLRPRTKSFMVMYFWMWSFQSYKHVVLCSYEKGKLMISSERIQELFELANRNLLLIPGGFVDAGQ